MTAPKPCPFCGKSPNVREADGWWFVECIKPRSHNCPAFAYTGAETREEAITRWNTRHEPAALPALVEALTEVEWAGNGWTTFHREPATHWACPSCGGAKPDEYPDGMVVSIGHKPDCKLRAALALVRGDA